jgi:hypothetical protein
MRTFARLSGLLLTIGLVSAALAEPRMVLIEEFSNTS